MERILSHDDLAYVRIQPEFDHFRSSGFRANPFSTPSTEPQSNHQAAEPVKITVDANPDMDDKLLFQLNKLSELRKKGILSEDEFIFERKKILRM